MPHALIVGASRGLGLGLAQEMIRRGWTVTGTVRKPADRAAVEAAGASAALADTTDAGSLEALRSSLGATLDLLFINAGISEPAGVGEIDPAGIGHLFLTNAVAPIRAATALMPCLAPDGMIAFMSSRMGSVELTGDDHLSMYRASKAALNSLTRGFAAHAGERPVLTLHPGWVRTDMGGEAADLDVGTSARGLADVIESRRGTVGSAFMDYSGAELAW